MKAKFMLLIFLLGITFIIPLNTNAETKKLYDFLKENATNDSTSSTYVESSSGIDFSEVSSDTNGKGLYMIGSSINSEFPIIYYRGDINNNNILYGGFCWKIIRSTSTGGLKLLYSGIPVDGKCNNQKEALAIGKTQYNSVNSEPYYGWMYNTESGDVNVISSTAKLYLDEWFKNNMLDYVKELEDSVWCNDRSINNGIFDSRTRLENGKPTLECVNKDDSFTVFSDKGNKKLTYPTAIINADELTYAGEVLKKTQTNTFVNIGYSYWSMTPYTLNKNMYPNSKGMLNMYTFTYSAGIRPMVAIRNSAVLLSGDGTGDNPYVVGVEKQYRIITDEYVTSNKTESEASDLVNINYKERIGLKFVSYKVTDLDNNELDLNINDGKFLMPAKDIKIIAIYRELKAFHNVSTANENIEIIKSNVEEDQFAEFRINTLHGFKINKIITLDENENELNLNIEELDGKYIFLMPNKDVVLDLEIEEKEKYEVDGDIDNLNDKLYYVDDKIEFDVVQQENHQVKSIYLTDKEGNIIDTEIINNNGRYSFVMPDMDIKINVEYEIINPSTFDGIRTSIVLFLIYSTILVCTLIYYKKRI